MDRAAADNAFTNVLINRNCPFGRATTHHLHPRAAGLRYAYTHKCVSRPDNLLTLQTRDIRAQNVEFAVPHAGYQPSPRNATPV